MDLRGKKKTSRLSTKLYISSYLRSIFMALVTFQKHSDSIGILTFNDPDSLNAMSEAMAAEFKAMVAKISSEKMRALILTGAGRAFSAGGDLEMLEKKQKLSAEENRLKMLDFYNSFLCILDLKVPLVAAINGHAIGAGLCLASACDIRVASDKARLGFTFVKLGLHPGMGATFSLPRILGYSKSMELLLTGRIIEAPEALQIGLVSKIVDTSKVLEEAIKLADEISAAGPECVRQTLETLRAGKDLLNLSLQREAVCQARNYASAEFKEGVSAVKEKRAPKF